MSSRRHFIQLMPVAAMTLLAACSKKEPMMAAPADKAAMPMTPPHAMPSMMAGAAALPMLDEMLPAAMALGYVADAARADTTKFKAYATGQTCAGCALYQGKAGDATGPCGIFPGARVTAAGWCASFTKKPA